MQTSAPPDDFARLVPAARAPGRVRVRVGVGAAIVLLIAALVTAVIVSALGQQAGHEVVAPAATDNAGDGAAAAPGDSPDPGGSTGATGATAATGAIIFVHVLGAVRNPGLYELRDGARVMDVVAAAGGLVETADPAGVNLARLVSDGEQILIPHIGDAPPGAAGAGAAPAPGGKISINTATVAELDTLPRIGPLMAQRIVDYRAANGRFAGIDDLRNVTGIGEKTFEGLKDLITP